MVAFLQVDAVAAGVVAAAYLESMQQLAQAQVGPQHGHTRAWQVVWSIMNSLHASPLGCCLLTPAMAIVGKVAWWRSSCRGTATEAQQQAVQRCCYPPLASYQVAAMARHSSRWACDACNNV